MKRSARPINGRQSALGLGLALALTLALTAASAPRAGAAETFVVDTVHSSVMFRIKHMNTSYAYGRFDDIGGQFTLDEADASKCKFDLTVKTSTVDTANEKRDQHLKGADFFNAAQYPTITFKSTSVKKTGTTSYEVAGDLTLHGVTRPIVAKVEKTGTGKDMRGGGIAGVEAGFTINRSEFGMKGMMGGLGDEVRIVVSLEGGKK